jgi:hypothetical protein
MQTFWSTRRWKGARVRAAVHMYMYSRPSPALAWIRAFCSNGSEPYANNKAPMVVGGGRLANLTVVVGGGRLANLTADRAMHVLHSTHLIHAAHLIHVFFYYFVLFILVSSLNVPMALSLK